MQTCFNSATVKHIPASPGLHKHTHTSFLTKLSHSSYLTLSQGYEYQTEPGKCCGTCVQMDCIFTTPDNVTVHVIEVSTAANNE